MSSFVTRFAPSPSGYLHRGHAFSALCGFRAAQAASGRFLLRIEDIDADRCRPEFDAAILEDLRWLGICWSQPPRRQSLRLDAYRDALETLRRRDLLYRCFRTRGSDRDTIARAPHGEDSPTSPGPLPRETELRLMAEGRPFAWRLSIARALSSLGDAAPASFDEQGEGPDGETGRIAVNPRAMGDVILARKGLGVSYHLAVVVDDADQGVTHVIRGRDLFASTHVQRLLQALLGLPTPIYRHHRLILRPDGKRFAKRDTAETLRDLRARGVTPEGLCAELGF